MISVLASVKLKSGTRDEFLKHFINNVPAVLEEAGCIEYFPAIDVESGLANQQKDPDSVTVIEKWESIEALQLHLKATHMTVYKENVKHIVESLSLKVLEQPS